MVREPQVAAAHASILPHKVRRGSRSEPHKAALQGWSSTTNNIAHHEVAARWECASTAGAVLARHLTVSRRCLGTKGHRVGMGMPGLTAACVQHDIVRQRPLVDMLTGRSFWQACQSEREHNVEPKST